MPSASARSIPDGWPPDVVYLTRPQYSRGVNQSLLVKSEAAATSGCQRKAVEGSSKGGGTGGGVGESGGGSGGGSGTGSDFPVLAASAVPSPCPLVRIAVVGDASHPACGQRGLFAARPLAAGSFILCYLGWTHRGGNSGGSANDSSADNGGDGGDAGEADPESSYDLSLDGELDVAVDATTMGNEARFVNDYRGVRAGGPNAEFRDVLVRIGGGMVERRVGVFVKPTSKMKVKAKRAEGTGTKYKKAARDDGIKKGEEIVVSYGKGFWKAHGSM